MIRVSWTIGQCSSHIGRGVDGPCSENNLFDSENPPETNSESKKRSFNELVECERELTAAREENNEKRNKIILFILCALGILIFYLLFGILQAGLHGHLRYNIGKHL